MLYLYEKQPRLHKKAFSAIPILFAVQQFAEGMLWVSLTNSGYQHWEGLATYLFLFFAWVIWPVYIPISIRLLEIDRVRKWVINLFILIGIAVSFTLVNKLIYHNVLAEVMGYHIKYDMDYKFQFPLLFGILYFIPIVFSLFATSFERMTSLGVAVLISFLISAIFYADHLISIWCFFAAVTSLMVFWTMKGVQARKLREKWAKAN